jgi:hypothetical protein
MFNVGKAQAMITEAQYWEMVERLDRQSHPDRERQPQRKPSTSRHRRRKSKHNAEFVTLRLKPTPEQEATLTEFMRIGFDVLWLKAIAFKRSYDTNENNRAEDPLTGTALCKHFTQWRKADPMLHKLPYDAAEYALHKAVAAYCKHEEYDKPKRVLKFGYVRFGKATDQDGEPINDRTIHLPKLGFVKFTGSEGLLHVLRTANITIRLALVERDAEGWKAIIQTQWEVVKGDTVLAKLTFKQDRINDAIDQLKQRSDGELPADKEIEAELSKFGLRQHEIAKIIRIERGWRNASKATREILHEWMYEDGRPSYTYLPKSHLVAELKKRGIKLTRCDLDNIMDSLGITKLRRKISGKAIPCYDTIGVMHAG